LRQSSNETSFSTGDSWVILSSLELGIKAKIDAIGRPLKDWEISINYGIKTGLNDAFIIDSVKRDELVKADPKSDEVIRPILRGRDINRYGNHFAGWWLINLHNGIREKGIKPLKADDYPVIKDYLNQYYNELVNRADQGDTPYNLRNCAYTDDFFKQKIVWAETMRIHKNSNGRFPRFGYDKNGEYVTDKTCFFATGDKIEYIMVFFNSMIGRYLCSKYVSILDNGGYLMQKAYLENIPIPDFEKQMQPIIDSVLTAKQIDDEIEDKIDSELFKLFCFGKEEIDFITNECLQ
jgi:hypothetical protein